MVKVTCPDTLLTMEKIDLKFWPDIRDVGKFLKCIADNGGNDISKKKAQKCVDNYLGWQ